ncbi:MAG: hypothetical protein VB046_04160 [Paludibacter sp.]|nr:hypothetical protein [Paludibacter sp.]
METIFRNIEKLLATNDHAVVPGLGGFVVQQQPARISGKYIVAPRATISFNPLISQNDGMLAIEISRQKGISYREATVIAEKETREFLTKLKAVRKMAYGRLGTFFLENDSHLIFTPATDLSFLPANVGLQDLLLPTNNPVSKDIVFTISARRMMKYAAIFITFIALLFSPRLNDSTNITRADFSQLNRVELPEITVSPIIETTIQEIQPQEPAKESTEDTLLQDKNNYKVIVAAFDLPEKAMLLRDKLKKEDYPESEIIVTSNNTRVAIRSFSNIISAVNYMEEVRNEDPRFADAWVMKSE